MLKTFKLGGVHPPENKLSAHKAIEAIEAPEKIFVPLGQNLGAPSVATVKRGDKVKTGQLIAKGEAFISAMIHSPVSGTVDKIDTHIDASGYRRDTIIITREGDEWEEGIDLSADLRKEITLSPQEIVEKVKASGIVGLGGATFPTHVKLMVPDGKKAEYLIINAVECEPYLTADHQLMLEKADEIVVGVQILMKAIGVDKAIIGIENNKPDAIEHMNKSVANFAGITVQALKVMYPQGAEKQLIKACVNREVPSGKLPIEVGCVVQNVGTAFAVYEAVQKNKPLIERVVTVTGKNVSIPSNFMARIGTPVSLLIEKAGGIPEDNGKIINGGPMMGKAINSTDVPVTKGTSGILLMSEKEAKRVREYNCVRCARCTTVCPMGLEPFLLGLAGESLDWEIAEKEQVMDCIECGSCQYTCPSGRPLLDNIRLGKFKVGQIMRSRKN
ncbi:MAG: electron transport complex subunit RsxC [Marinilabiliales bacterium]|nr:MAG: electron transport complex subunit RsxC [Marinilabiliales bacterium]